MTSAPRRWSKLAGGILVAAALVAIVVYVTQSHSSLSRPAPEPSEASAKTRDADHESAMMPPTADSPRVWASAEDLVAEARRTAGDLRQAFPRNAKATAIAARIHYSLGEADKAKQCSEECLKIDPSLGKALADMGETAILDKADLENLYAALREIHLNVGRLYANASRQKDAERHWLRALALDPANHQTREFLELLYREQGRLKEAAYVSRGGR